MSNSEYRNTFVSKYNQHLANYSENLGYRSSRRNREAEHNKDVFTWEPEVWEKRSCSSILADHIRPGVTPSSQYKHAVAFNAQKQQETPSSLESADEAKSSTSVAIPKTPPPTPKNALVPKQQQQITKKTKPKRPVRPVSAMHPVPKAKKVNIRPKSSEGVPSATSIETKASSAVNRPPFAMFGNKVRDVDLCQKRTHNVKSPVDVYESAIRASQQRRDQQAKRLKRELQIALSSRGSCPVFDDKIRRETAAWATEYTNRYRPHSSDVYLRNAKGRMHVQRCSDISVF